MKNTLRAAAVAAVAALATMPAAAQELLRVHSFSSPQAPEQRFHILPWAEEIQKASGGKLKVEVYTNMSLGGKPADLVQQLEDGVVDMIITVPGFTPGRFPGLEGTELPFTNAGTAVGQTAAIFDWAVTWLGDNELKGFKLIEMHTTDAAVLHMHGAAIATQGDLAGKRIRVPGRFVGEAVKALGGTPVGMPLNGVYEALERGQLDGMTMNWAIMGPYKLHEVTRFHLNQPIYQNPIVTLMSKKSYDRLPADLRALIDARSGVEYSMRVAKNLDDMTAPTKEMIAKAGGTVSPLASAEHAKWVATVQPIYDLWIAEMDKRGLPGRKMLDDLLARTAKHGRK